MAQLVMHVMRSILYVSDSFFFFTLHTAYEMRISDWSSDVCSSDLAPRNSGVVAARKTAWKGPIAPRVRSTVATTAALLLSHGKCAHRGKRGRSEERRVGKECVCRCRYRVSPYQEKKNTEDLPQD